MPGRSLPYEGAIGSAGDLFIYLDGGDASTSKGGAKRRQTLRVSGVTSHDASMPAIGTHLRVLRDSPSEGGSYQSAIVVGHLHDPELGNVLELRLSDSRRLQRVWPTSTIRLSPAA
jgi:hypothetical protein